MNDPFGIRRPPVRKVLAFVSSFFVVFAFVRLILFFNSQSELPISVEIREGLLSHGVFIIRNLSNSPVRGQIHFERNLNRNQSVDRLFVMDAFATNEFGRLELGGQGLAKGDRGYIKIDGYLRSLRFEVFDQQWFQRECVSVFGLDIPVFRRQESGFAD